MSARCRCGCTTTDPTGYTEVRNDALDFLLLNAKTTADRNQPPTFKPDPYLGEGEATPEELEYRQKLLDLLQRTWKASKKIINDDTITDDEKIHKLDIIINDYIKEGKQLPLTYITDAFRSGVDKANDYLVAKGIDKVKVSVAEEERLSNIIAQQQDNIEDIAYTLRGRLRQRIRLSKVMDTYAKK